MSNYKIKVNIEIVECQEPVQVRPVKLEDGCFEFNISDGRACSIDDCEQALLETNYSALREALKQHLSEISKKNGAAVRRWPIRSQYASLFCGW